MAYITLTTNPYARRDYNIVDTYDAGIVLQGAEIKSLCQSQAEISGAYVQIEHTKDGEVWLSNAYIAPYVNAGHYGDYEPRRTRKLLLHREEIDKAGHKVARQRLALVPLEIYMQHGRAKLRFGIGTGRKKADRREFLRQKEATRHKEGQLSR